MNNDNLTLKLCNDLLAPEEEVPIEKKNPRRLMRRDDEVIGSPVAYLRRDSYQRVVSLRRWIAKQERPAGGPERRHPGRPRRID